MLKWRKVDKQGRPARRNCNSFEEHDYINDGLLGLKIINGSFGYDKEPWTLVTKKRLGNRQIQTVKGCQSIRGNVRFIRAKITERR